MTASGNREPIPAQRFRASAEATIARDDLIELRDVTLEIALEAGDREWAQSCLIQLARHRDADVRGNALLGFGHLARRFGRLDSQRVRRIVAIAFVDPSASVREKAARRRSTCAPSCNGSGRRVLAPGASPVSPLTSCGRITASRNFQPLVQWW